MLEYLIGFFKISKMRYLVLYNVISFNDVILNYFFDEVR